MALVFHEFDVREVVFGASTSLDAGLLTIDVETLDQALRERDPHIEKVSIRIARPGEATRIVCAKDAIQPRFKVDDAPLGTGVTHVLNQIAVVTCGPIVAFQEGIIDMSGRGANYTPFSQLTLVVIEIEVAEGVVAHEHEAAIRSAGLSFADLLAQASAEKTADRTNEIFWDEKSVPSGLPRIAYVDMVLSQGLLHDTYVLGRDAKQGLPVSVDPRIAVDGGVVSGNCVSACDKNTTYHHQNNPLIAELLEGHAIRWDFAGVVITNEPTRLARKQQSAERAVQLVRELRADGAVISKEGFGNPDADLMMIIQGLETAGIRTVAITDEFAGTRGDSQSLADTAPEADALVSVGNANQRVVLPPMKTVIGPLPDVARLAGGYAQSLRDDGSMEVELQAIVGSTNQLGFSCLTCQEI